MVPPAATHNDLKIKAAPSLQGQAAGGQSWGCEDDGGFTAEVPCWLLVERMDSFSPWCCCGLVLSSELGGKGCGVVRLRGCLVGAWAALLWVGAWADVLQPLRSALAE